MIRILVLLAGAILARLPSAQAADRCDSPTYPSPANSTVPSVIVGTASGDRIGSGFVMIVRDQTNQPMPNAFVWLDFTGTGVTPYRTQNHPTQARPGFCDMISQRADSNGRVVIDARLSGFTNADTVAVYTQVDTCCAYFLLRKIKARSTDIVTSVGSTQFCCQLESTDATDTSYVFSRLGGAHPQCDFNQDGLVNSTDHSIVMGQYNANVPALLCVP